MKTYLRRVGEDISEYFPPACLPAWHWVGTSVWVAVPALSTWLSTSENIPFSLSVWFVTPTRDLRLLGLGSVAVPLLQRLASRVVILERFDERAAALPLLPRLGLGKLRYWRVVRAFGGKYPSSTLACRLESRLPEKAMDLGIFPTVAEPLVTMAPLAVMVAMVPKGFLKPKVLVGVRVVELEGGFLVSSMFVCRSDWILLERGERHPFSDTLASSVLPVKGKMKSCFLKLWIQ